MTESPLSKNERRLLTTILISIVFFIASDIYNDSIEGVKGSHLFLELIIACSAAVGFFVLMKNSFSKSSQLMRTQALIVEREMEIERWKLESQKHIQGLSIAIDTQLARWSLTPSEKEVALLLLKGLSLKEIAEIRNTAEKTVRTQSVSIYSKSGLAGRSELSAFFLEDLMLPQEFKSATETKIT